MAIIDEYWSGVLQRLQAEVSVFNRLIAHQGERGRENEQALSRVLEGLVPRRLGIGTGMLFDISENYSKQTDIVLFDQVDAPTILAQTTQLLHPVEQVLICIEVKTTLDKEEIQDAAEKKESIRILVQDDRPGLPLFFLFAYSADTSPATLCRNLNALTDEKRPDLTCVLDPGFLDVRSRLLDPTLNDDHYKCGVTLLHALDNVGLRKQGKYVSASPENRRSYEQRAGGLYPVVDHSGDRMLSDPSRALLLFCEILIRSAALQSGQPLPVLSRYLRAPYRDLEMVK
jgi:hypothetical protein